MQKRVHATTQLDPSGTYVPLYLPSCFPTETHWLSSFHRSLLSPSQAHMHKVGFTLALLQ